MATSGATTTTSYVGNLETVTTSGSTTTTTNYFYAAGKLVAETVNGTATGLSGLTYLVTNYQGSPTEALDRTGTVTASRLYGPYGTLRYSNGAFPTEYGYTGQRADAATGLDYYGARYYDPLLAQFTSAIRCSRAGRLGYLFAGAGFALDSALSGLDYYDAHQDDPDVVRTAITYGLIHGAAVTLGSLAGAEIGESAGAWIGGAVGTVVGQAIIPVPGLGAVIGGAVGTVVGSGVGGAVGGFVGGLVAQAAVENFVLPSLFG